MEYETQLAVLKGEVRFSSDFSMWQAIYMCKYISQIFKKYMLYNIGLLVIYLDYKIQNNEYVNELL